MWRQLPGLVGDKFYEVTLTVARNQKVNQHLLMLFCILGFLVRTKAALIIKRSDRDPYFNKYCNDFIFQQVESRQPDLFRID